MNARAILIVAAGLAIGAAAAIAVFPEARQRLLPSAGPTTTGKALVGGPFTLADITGKRGLLTKQGLSQPLHARLRQISFRASSA
jgi:hypothetical protein